MSELSRTDRFAELLAEGLTLPQIRQRMNLTRRQAATIERLIRQDLGWQAV